MLNHFLRGLRRKARSDPAESQKNLPPVLPERHPMHPVVQQWVRGEAIWPPDIKTMLLFWTNERERVCSKHLLQHFPGAVLLIEDSPAEAIRTHNDTLQWEDFTPEYPDVHAMSDSRRQLVRQLVERLGVGRRIRLQVDFSSGRYDRQSDPAPDSLNAVLREVMRELEALAVGTLFILRDVGRRQPILEVGQVVEQVRGSQHLKVMVTTGHPRYLSRALLRRDSPWCVNEQATAMSEAECDRVVTAYAISLLRASDAVLIDAKGLTLQSGALDNGWRDVLNLDRDHLSERGHAVLRAAAQMRYSSDDEQAVLISFTPQEGNSWLDRDWFTVET